MVPCGGIGSPAALLLVEWDVLNGKLLSVCLVCRMSGTVCDEGGEVYSTAVESGINVWLAVPSVSSVLGVNRIFWFQCPFF
jgi:hypothetical protein